MTENNWVVKVSFIGGESVLGLYSTKAEALSKASELNTIYQSTQYYAEPYSTERARSFFDSIAQASAVAVSHMQTAEREM